jgi:hypothetical protein
VRYRIPCPKAAVRARDQQNAPAIHRPQASRLRSDSPPMQVPRG